MWGAAQQYCWFRGDKWDHEEDWGGRSPSEVPLPLNWLVVTSGKTLQKEWGRHQSCVLIWKKRGGRVLLGKSHDLIYLCSIPFISLFEWAGGTVTRNDGALHPRHGL